LVHRLQTTTVLATGLGLNLIGATGLALSVVFGWPLPLLLGSLFVMVSAVGLVFPTATALALADFPDRAGAASSLLGLLQFLAGALAAPLVGIAGGGTAVPLGVVALAASASGMAIFATMVVPVLRRRSVPSVPARSAGERPGTDPPPVPETG